MRRSHWKGKRGKDTANWKGGRRLTADGYVRIRMRDHPRSNNGYVLEHILVAEKKLGRPLKYYGPGHRNNETVHHRNGIKTDNRPSNLIVLSNSDHTAHEWDLNPLKFPQSKESQKQTPTRYHRWRIANGLGR